MLESSSYYKVKESKRPFYDIEVKGANDIYKSLKKATVQGLRCHNFQARVT
jgi:hypothetical protein